MKFIALLLTTGSLAAQLGTPVLKSSPLIKRNGASVSSATASISTEVGNLETAVTGFSGAGSVSSLQTASDVVLSAIEGGITTVNDSADLTSDEALPLASQIQSLSDTVNAMVEAVIAKKSDTVFAGVGPTVLQTLNAQLNATQVFSTALISKVPAELQSVAQNLAQPIINALNNGVSAFSDQTGAVSTFTGDSSLPY